MGGRTGGPCGEDAGAQRRGSHRHYRRNGESPARHYYLNQGTDDARPHRYAPAHMQHVWRSAMKLRRLVVCLALLGVPALALAQEATVIGTVTDSSGGVLPGVTVRAVHDATGNTF